MTKTIAINAGSSSLKWQLYQMPEEKFWLKAWLNVLIERFNFNSKIWRSFEQQILDIEDHTQAVKILLDDLIRFDIIKGYDEITGVGHRVVAGGEYFKESTVVEGDVLEKVEELGLLAPLHNPANAAGIRAFKELLPDITSVVVFDTSFHYQPCQRRLIATLYQLNTIQKTRFVNTVLTGQVTSLSQEKQRNFWVVLSEDLKLITCHIGNGASITAVKGGSP